jgi:hypothetical protein
MSKYFNNDLVKEKHRVQRQILKEADGDLRKYTSIVKHEAENLRKKFPGKFPQASQPLAAH